MTKTVQFIIIAKDAFSKVGKQVSRSMNQMNKSASNLAARQKALAQQGKTAASDLIAAWAGAKILMAPVRAFAEFESRMSNVSTLIDTSKESMVDMSNKVMGVSKRMPQPLNEIADSLYDIRSAGISASDQFKVLEGSAKLATAGLGTTKEATDLVTSAINAFGLVGEDQEKVYDNIFKTVKKGKTTISALAQGFGAVAGVVANANIPLDEYLSSMPEAANV